MSREVELRGMQKIGGKIHLLGQPFQIARVNDMGWPRLASGHP
jgi:hypothetical protein